MASSADAWRPCPVQEEALQQLQAANAQLQVVAEGRAEGQLQAEIHGEALGRQLLYLEGLTQQLAIQVSRSRAHAMLQ